MGDTNITQQNNGENKEIELKTGQNVTNVTQNGILSETKKQAIQKKLFMENKGFEITIKSSDLPLEEKRDLLWECFDILLSEKDLPSGDNGYQLDLNPPSGILVVDDTKSEDNKITKDSE